MKNQVRVIISDMQGTVLDDLTVTGNQDVDVNRLSQQVASQIEAGNFEDVE